MNESTSRHKASVSEELDTKCSVVKEDGRLCSRALSCKIHSMTAKRAVAGRSEPLDNLLRKSKRSLNMSSPLPFYGTLNLK